MICIPKLALEIQDLSLPATVLLPRLDDKLFSIFVACFLPLGLLACSLFSAAQDLFTSSSLLTIIIGDHGICSLIVWPVRQAGCPVFSNLPNFSACQRAALKIGYQSSVKESESKKRLVQRVLVLLWWKVQYGAVSPLMWAWT